VKASEEQVSNGKSRQENRLEVARKVNQKS